ncbi:MAG: site-specific integrase [Clostridiales bacterium]|jgi:integrase|nr:site-specific integrase [Clostridiales bacterium]
MKEQIRLYEFLDMWLENVIKGNVRISTHTAYKGYIENHIKRLLYNEQIKEISIEKIQKFIGQLGSEEKALSPKTIRSIFIMLKTALQCAVDYEYIIKNPCVKVRLPKLKEKEINVFTHDEQRKLETAILNSCDRRHIGVLLCLYTGLRIGELCALKWEDINLKEKTLTVRNSLNRVSNDNNNESKTQILQEEPKTKKSKRIIPLPEFICEILCKQKKDSKSQHVISMKSGKPVEPRAMQTIYKKLLKIADIAEHNFHVLRHTFATRAIELGADVKTISEMLGHSNSMITINLYVHSLVEQKQKVMQGLNNYFCNKKGSRK